MSDNDANLAQRRHGWGLVFILAGCTVLSFVDRQMLSLLIEPIRADLGLSDTQLGLLQGTVFAFTYAALAIPCAALADRTVRMKVIASGVLVWSLMTSVAGFARNFATLAASRFGIAVGEATLNPAAYSILADVFPPQKLALPLSIFAAGTVTGSALAFIGGGWVYQHMVETGGIYFFGPHSPWQAVFLILGGIGIVTAPLLYLVSEPARRGVRKPEHVGAAAPLKFLWAERATVVPLFLGFAVSGLAATAINSWMPAMLSRSFGYSIKQAGTALGLVFLICGVSGNIIGGWLSDTLEQSGVAGAKLKVAATAVALASIANTLGPLSASGAGAVTAYAATIFVVGGVAGTVTGALQTMTPNRLRATVTAIYLFVFNIIGLGLGPVIVALVSDHVYGGGDGLRYAISTVCAIAGPSAAVLLYIASRRLKILVET